MSILCRYFACFSFLLFTANSMAVTPSQSIKEQIQVPQCLAKHLPSSYPVLDKNDAFQTIEVPMAELENIIAIADRVGCGRFKNITHLVQNSNHQVDVKLVHEQLEKTLLAPKVIKNTYQLQHATEVNETIHEVDSNQILGNLTHLTNYVNRSARQDSGVEAAQWLKSSVDTLIAASGKKDASTYLVATGYYYKQPSVVTVIGKNINAPAVVIGAHMDTLDGTMPGAGDDGSGSASLLEMTRVLLNTNYEFKRPIYIIWYAAEERGMVGSQYVVDDFLRKKIPVYTVMQFDMTGYRSNPNDPTMWIFRDYTDSNLSNFVTDLIKTYIKVPVKYSQCGYGCSDHVSWTEAGFAAAFPCETSYQDHNPYIHSSRDTISLLNTEHLTNFTKLALAYILELAIG